MSERKLIQINLIHLNILLNKGFVFYLMDRSFYNNKTKKTLKLSDVEKCSDEQLNKLIDN